MDTATIGEGQKITVVGKVDPLKLREKVEQKTHKKIELISPVPKKEANNGDNKENAKGKENEGGDNQKQEKKKDPKDKNSKDKPDDKKSKEKEVLFSINQKSHCF